MLLVAALGALVALVPALALRGFTVDDALISARYATHVARGLGYRFNALGVVTDGVTPLGWPYLLAPFAAAGPLAALTAAKVIGALAWTLASAALAVAIDRIEGSPARFVGLALVAVSAPLAAWSVAGMETGVVIALVTCAVVLRERDRGASGALVAGLAAGMRPELIPFALALAAAPSITRSESADDLKQRAKRIALAALPAVVVAAVRLSLFGRLVPLSFVAKPPEPALGARYALACFLLTGPVALLAPRVWRRLDGWPRGLLAAVVVHFAAVALAGGDWMPLSRLVAPVLPAVALGAAHVAAIADVRATALRVLLALAGEMFQLARVGPSAAGVGAARLHVIDELRGSLVASRVVATLDIGWVGAATGATVVDLAGLTDPAIAVLPGGHTSKAIPVGLLDARKVDAVVLLLKDGATLEPTWTDSFFARIVELRLASIPHVGEAFAPVATSAEPHLGYVVLRRSAATER